MGGGPTLDIAQIPDGVVISDETNETVPALFCAGICQDDIRHVNLVWNEEAKRVMAIDFDLAYLTDAAAKRLCWSPGEAAAKRPRKFAWEEEERVSRDVPVRFR